MTDIFSMFLDGVGDCYALLDRIEVVTGVSVLDFLIAIVVISVIIPTLLTLVHSSYSAENARIDKERNREESYQWHKERIARDRRGK